MRAFAAAGVTTYLYSFSFRPSSYKDPASLLCQLDDELGCGVYHSAELSYVFDHTRKGDDANLASAIGNYWTNFAKSGSPNGDNVPIAWPSYDAVGDHHLE